MRLYASTLFLTLVLSAVAALAAPVNETQPPTIELSPKERSEPIYTSTDRTERNWSLRLGFLGGALTETNQAEQMNYYGLRFDIFRETLSTWEFELDRGKGNFLHLSVGKKFYFPLEPVTVPYYRLAVGDLIDSTDGLGAVFNPKKIQAIAAVGLDDMFKLDKRVQGELSVAYAIVGPQFEFSIGIAF